MYIWFPVDCSRTAVDNLPVFHHDVTQKCLAWWVMIVRTLLADSRQRVSDATCKFKLTL